VPRPEPARDPVRPARRARDGLRNLLLITGDPGRVGDYPDATAVFDVDSIGLTNVVARLQPRLRRRRAADRRADGVSHRRVGESGASNLDEELRRFDLQGRGGRGVRRHPAGIRVLASSAC
jgi:hypothetical protein